MSKTIPDAICYKGQKNSRVVFRRKETTMRKTPSFSYTVFGLLVISLVLSTPAIAAVVEFSKAEFLERAKAESSLSSARAVGEQDDREFLLVGAFLEDRDGSVQVFTEHGPGARDALRGERLLCEVDATPYGDHDGMP